MTKKVKFVLKLFKYVFLLFFTAVLLLVVRLSIEPIHIQNFIPKIVNTLKSQDSELDVSVKDAYIELAISKGRFIDIVLKETIVSDKKEFVLNADEARVSFNPFALLIGRVVVSDVVLNKFFVQADLTSSDKKTEKKSVSLERKINRARRYFERLDSLVLSDGELTLLMEDKNLLIPKLSADIQKQFDKIDTKANATLYLEGVFVDVEMQ